MESVKILIKKIILIYFILKLSIVSFFLPLSVFILIIAWAFCLRAFNLLLEFVSYALIATESRTRSRTTTLSKSHSSTTWNITFAPYRPGGPLTMYGTWFKFTEFLLCVASMANAAAMLRSWISTKAITFPCPSATRFRTTCPRRPSCPATVNLEKKEKIFIFSVFVLYRRTSKKWQIYWFNLYKWII